MPTMTKYSTEVVTDLNASPQDVAAALEDTVGEGEYRILHTELVDSDHRPGHEEEIWLVVFETPHQFSDEEMEDLGVDLA